MKKLLMTAGAAVLAMGTAASAATLSISGGTAGSIPGGGVNNVLVDLLGVNTLSGFYGSQIVANAGPNSKIKVEVMGYEALFLNEFATVEDSFTTSGGAPKKVIGDPDPLATWLTDASGGSTSASAPTATVPRVSSRPSPTVATPCPTWTK